MKTLIFSALVVLPSLFLQAQGTWPPQVEFPEPALSASLPPYLAEAAEPAGTGNTIADYLADTKPWLNIAANSEQRQPVYLGRRPRDLELGGGERYSLPESLKSEGERQIREIRAALVRSRLIAADKTIIIEAWPVRDDQGALTWAFARWKPAAAKNFSWLDIKLPESEGLVPFLSERLSLASENDFKKIFSDVLELDSLYDKPLFGDILWLDNTGRVHTPWLNPDLRERFAATAREMGLIPVLLPQPARVDGNPVSYIIRSRQDSVLWPNDIPWGPGARSGGAASSAVKIKTWPKNFTEEYKKDLMMLTGETEAVFPVSKRKVKFVKKNNIQPDNQLADLVSFLEEKYALLGIKTRRQDFVWRGARQTNLIAVIPGADHSRPILMADHIDTAFCGEVFDQTKERVSAPGADDNLSATVTLLRAAEILRGKQPARDIWLVHLTGEEFPADDLGARYFISDLLRTKKDIGGLVLLDMIGWRKAGDPVFQVSAGESAQSLRLAQTVIDSAKGFSGLSPALRTRFDPRSYLYNTDGLIFSDAGFPVVLLNEHINAIENLDRAGYHDANDTSAMIDWGYATDIAKTAIEAVARLAGVK